MSASNVQVDWIGLEGSGALKLAEVSLITGIALAVLAFGGTEPASFAVVEILLAGVAIIFLVHSGWMKLPFSCAVLLAPALLMGVVLLQLCPFPASWVRTVAGGRTWGDGAHFAPLTIEPFTTRVHFLTLLTCVIGFFLAYIASQDRNRKRHLIVAIVALGSFEAFYGLLQYLTGWQRIFAYVKKYDLQEATGTYINRNHYAGFLEMVLPFALALAFHEFGKLQKKPPQLLANLRRLLARSDLQKPTFWLSIAAVLFVALIYSRSRMGILAASTSVMVTFGLACVSRFRGRVGLLLGATFLILSVGVAAWIGPGPIVERFQGVTQEYASRDHSRLSIWRDTIELIRKHPWLGTGFGTFPIAYTAVQTTFLGEFVNHAHNDYLELASDVGIPAALGLIVSIIWLLARAVHTFRIAKENFDRFLALGCAGSILAILLHSLADFNLYIPANSLLFASILGLTMGLGTPRVRPASEGR